MDGLCTKRQNVDRFTNRKNIEDVLRDKTWMTHPRVKMWIDSTNR
jgi:hypothetical protein